MKAYLVWDAEATEGVVFLSYNDARYAATGKSLRQDTSEIADYFRLNVPDEQIFKIKDIEISE